MKKEKNLAALTTIFLLILICRLSATENLDVDENMLFNDSNTVQNIEQISKISAATTAENKNQLSGVKYSFSGDIGTISSFYRKNKSSSLSPVYSNGTTHSVIRGNFLLDVRLENKAKAFLNLELDYSPQNDSYLQTQKINGVSADKFYNEFTIKEFFVDADISKKIYLRLGKQFLQWGRCYFWNPSDLVNTERRNFNDLNKSREGVFGLKTHIPFGAKKNFYSFADFSNEDKTNRLALSSKYEFVLDKTEMAFAFWIKQGHKPVFTYDISSRIQKYDIRGELSVSRSSQKYYFDPQSAFIYKKENIIQPRCAINIGRTFNYEIPDRITANIEFYYNRAGYSKNVFSNQFWAYGNLYEPNNHGKYYTAFFGSFNRFLIENCNLNFNAITNLSDKSFTISPGLSYEPFFNFTLNMNLYFYGGGRNKEYTFSGNSMAAEFRSNLIF